MTLGLVYEWPAVMRTCMLGKSYSVQSGETISEIVFISTFFPTFVMLNKYILKYKVGSAQSYFLFQRAF